MRTIRRICLITVDMKFFISLECLLQQYDLLLALDTSSSSICSALLVTLHLVQLDHLFDSLQILFLNIELELNLGQHELDSGTKIGGVVFNEV